MGKEMSSNTKNKRYKRIKDHIKDIKSIKGRVESRGRFFSLTSLDPIISLVEGSITTIYGTAGSGKTQFCIETCVSQAEVYGSKTAYYLTEAGTFEETVLDIAQTYLQKTLSEITDEELLTALEWMDEYIFIIDISRGLMSMREIYEQVLSMEKEYDIKINNVVLDHFGNILPDPKNKGATIADNVKFTFQAMTATSKLKNFHTIILFHTARQEPVKCPVSGKFYLLKAEPYELSGGIQANFLSMQMINVHRFISREDQLGVIDPQTGMPYELNETHITCTKVKPKQSGSLGTVKIYFDWKKQSYYEIVNGEKRYRRGSKAKDKPSAIQPNLDFGVKDIPF